MYFFYTVLMESKGLSQKFIVYFLIIQFLFLYFHPCTRGTVINNPDIICTLHSDDVYCVAWSQNGDRIVSGDTVNLARVWDPSNSIQICQFTGHSHDVWDVAWSPNGNEIASVSSDKYIRIWNSTTGIERLYCNINSYLYCVAWSPTGDKIVSGAANGRASIRDANSGSELQSFNEHSSEIWGIDWSPDGSKIGTASLDGTIKICDPLNGNIFYTFTRHSGGVRSIAWSPDGTKIISGSDDRSAKIWNSNDGAEIATLIGHSNTVFSVAWSPDGNWVATASSDNTAKIWDANSGDLELTLSSHNYCVWGIDWSPDSMKVVTVSSDNSARVWDLSQYLNTPPDDPIVSNPAVSSVNRGFTATISATTADDQTPTNQLTPEFQYKYHSNNTWSNDLLSQPRFSSNQWHVDFTPCITDNTGSCDFRVRFGDEAGAYSDWGTIENAIDVLNNPPEIGWIAPPPSSVFKGEQYTLNVDLIDVEDDTVNLTISAYLSKAGTNFWSSDYFSSPQYIQELDKWMIPFTFPLNCQGGVYDIRIKCIDTDGNSSAWYYLNNSITLTNNPPSLIDFTISYANILRGNSVSLWLEASDPEDGADIQLPIIETKSPTSGWKGLSSSYNFDGDNFTAKYTPGASSELGKHSFRIKLIDNENTSTNWIDYNEILTVMNNPIAICDELVKLQGNNDKITLVDLSQFATDYEDVPSSFTWTVVDYKPESLFNAYMKGSSTVEIHPSPAGLTGTGSMDLKVVDRDGGEACRTVDVEIIDSSECDISISLSSPINEAIISNMNVNLSWSVEGVTTRAVYKLYLGDTVDNMSLKFDNLYNTRKKIMDLEDGKIYYWKVSAEITDIPGFYESEIWSFEVNKGFIPPIQISFDVSDVHINRGETKTIELILTHSGDEPLTVNLEVMGELSKYATIEGTGNVIIDKEIRIPVKIFSDDSIEPGSYTLMIKVRYSDKEEIAQLDVFQLGASKSKSGSSSWIYMLLVIILIVFIIAGAVIYVIRSRNKKNEEVYITRHEDILHHPYQRPFQDGLNRIPPRYGMPDDGKNFDQPNRPIHQFGEYQTHGSIHEVGNEPHSMNEPVFRTASFGQPQTAGRERNIIDAVPFDPVLVIKEEIYPQQASTDPLENLALPIVSVASNAPITPSQTVNKAEPIETKPLPPPPYQEPDIESSAGDMPITPSQLPPPPDSDTSPVTASPSSQEATKSGSTSFRVGLRRKPSFLSVKRTMLFRVEESMPCSICYGSISEGLQAIRCSCGELSHLSCGIRVSLCPSCSASYDEILDSASEEAIIKSVEDSKRTAKREVATKVETLDSDNLVKQLLKQVINKEITVEEYKMLVKDLKNP